jgi:hypothetical protein
MGTIEGSLSSMMNIVNLTKLAVLFLLIQALNQGQNFSLLLRDQTSSDVYTNAYPTESRDIFGGEAAGP